MKRTNNVSEIGIHVMCRVSRVPTTGLNLRDERDEHANAGPT